MRPAPCDGTYSSGRDVRTGRCLSMIKRRRRCTCNVGPTLRRPFRARHSSRYSRLADHLLRVLQWHAFVAGLQISFSVIPTAIDTNHSARHGRAPSRPSTPLILQRFQDVDARDKRGHDGSMVGPAGMSSRNPPHCYAMGRRVGRSVLLSPTRRALRISRGVWSWVSSCSPGFWLTGHRGGPC